MRNNGDDPHFMVHMSNCRKKPKHRTKHRKQKTDIVKKEIKVALYCSVLCKKRKGLKLKLIGSKSTKDFLWYSFCNPAGK